MTSELVDAAISWAATGGPPNWVFVLALLTAPSRWSTTAWRIVESRLKGDES